MIFLQLMGIFTSLKKYHLAGVCVFFQENFQKMLVPNSF